MSHAPSYPPRAPNRTLLALASTAGQPTMSAFKNAKFGAIAGTDDRHNTAIDNPGFGTS